jgi:hypothetical protein
MEIPHCHLVRFRVFTPASPLCAGAPGLTPMSLVNSEGSPYANLRVSVSIEAIYSVWEHLFRVAPMRRQVSLDIPFPFLFGKRIGLWGKTRRRSHISYKLGSSSAAADFTEIISHGCPPECVQEACNDSAEPECTVVSVSECIVEVCDNAPDRRGFCRIPARETTLSGTSLACQCADHVVSGCKSEQPSRMFATKRTVCVRVSKLPDGAFRPFVAWRSTEHNMPNIDRWCRNIRGFLLSTCRIICSYLAHSSRSRLPRDG